MTQIRMHRTFSRREREAFAHEELKMSRIQPSCELHLGGSERDRDRHRERLRQAGAKPWRGAFWHNDSHLPLTGLGKVKLIMTAHRCWIALDEVNHWQSNKQVLNDFCYLPWNYRMFRFLFFFSPAHLSKQQSTLSIWFYSHNPWQYLHEHREHLQYCNLYCSRDNQGNLQLSWLHTQEIISIPL